MKEAVELRVNILTWRNMTSRVSFC